MGKVKGKNQKSPSLLENVVKTCQELNKVVESENIEVFNNEYVYNANILFVLG